MVWNLALFLLPDELTQFIQEVWVILLEMDVQEVKTILEQKQASMRLHGLR